MKPTFQELLSGLALVALTALGVLMLFQVVPSANETSVTFILGALSGAITTSVAAGGKAKPPLDGTGG